MQAPFLLFALSLPHGVSEETWKKFYTDDHVPGLIQHGVVRTGLLYRRVPNPMGRQPPDDKTFLALCETDFARSLQTDKYKAILKSTSEVLPNGKAASDVADLDVRNYELVEVFDPKGLGPEPGPAQFILQAEAEPAEVEEFHQFYREDHAAMMAKHPGYRRTLHYRIGALEGGQSETLNPILILHEFDNFDGLGGPITNASLETDFAKRVLPRVKSMKARTLQLVASFPS